MANYQKLIINLGLQKIFFLLSLVFCSVVTAETLPSNYNNLDFNPEQNISSAKPSFHARGISNSQINDMVEELEQLINRVESTLITVEAKQNSSNSRMGEAIANIKNKSNRTSSLTNNGYSNSRTYRAIINGKELLRDFSILARQDFSQARRMWLDARRDLSLFSHFSM